MAHLKALAENPKQTAILRLEGLGFSAAIVSVSIFLDLSGHEEGTELFKAPNEVPLEAHAGAGPADWPGDQHLWKSDLRYPEFMTFSTGVN